MFTSLDRHETPWVRRVTRLGLRPGGQRLFLAATRCGDGWGLIALLPFVLFVAPQRGQAALGVGLPVALLIAGLVHVLKHAVRRARPTGLDLPWSVAAPGRFAFPSGHSAHAFHVLVLGAWVDPRLALLLAPSAVLIAVSRVALGVHYPSDVLTGSVLGTLLGLAGLTLGKSIGLLEWIVRNGPLA